MTTTAIHSVGFCACYSTQGDWAFDYALRLAQTHDLRLNIFHFLADPYDSGAKATGSSSAERNSLIIEREKKMRLYYDTRLGDYLNAGFRLCEDNEWTELHRCLCKREFDVLVLGYPSYGASFGGRSLTEFAHRFVCPVVLVGPRSPHEYHLNSPAALQADKLGLADADWCRVGTGLDPSLDVPQRVARPGVGC